MKITYQVVECAMDSAGNIRDGSVIARSLRLHDRLQRRLAEEPTLRQNPIYASAAAVAATCVGVWQERGIIAARRWMVARRG